VSRDPTCLISNRNGSQETRRSVYLTANVYPTPMFGVDSALPSHHLDSVTCAALHFNQTTRNLPHQLGDFAYETSCREWGRGWENVIDGWSRLVEEIAIFITSKRAKVSERETDFPFELRVNLGGEASQW